MNIKLKLATWLTSFLLFAGTVFLINVPNLWSQTEVNLMIGSGTLTNARDEISNHLFSPILFEEDKATGKSTDQFGPNQCDTRDFEMFVGLDKALLSNFGFPAESQIISRGEKPKPSRYGKRPVFEIGANGKVFRAYCF